jgi:hypothetical protein
LVIGQLRRVRRVTSSSSICTAFRSARDALAGQTMTASLKSTDCWAYVHRARKQTTQKRTRILELEKGIAHLMSGTERVVNFSDSALYPI